MSAFLVQNKTINKIITYLRDGDARSYLRREIHDKTGLNIAKPDDARKFGIKLLKCNFAGLKARYGDKEDKAYLKAYTYQWESVTPFEAVKAAHCLSYQCMEGNNDKTKIYKLLDSIIRSIEGAIIYASPEYDAAPWD